MNLGKIHSETSSRDRAILSYELDSEHPTIDRLSQFMVRFFFRRPVMLLFDFDIDYDETNQNYDHQFIAYFILARHSGLQLQQNNYCHN